MLHGGQREVSVPGHCTVAPPVPLPPLPVVPPAPAPPLPVVMGTHLPPESAYASLQRTAQSPFSQMATPLVGGAGHGSQPVLAQPMRGCSGTHAEEQHFSMGPQLLGPQLPASTGATPPDA